MRPLIPTAAILAGLLLAAGAAPAASAALGPPIPSAAPDIPEAMRAAMFDPAKVPAAEWRAIDPENTLYMELPTGRVVIELAPDFAPNHVADVKALVRSGYFDDSAIVRAQDNYVVQWSAPEDRKIKAGHDTLKAEFEKPIGKEPFLALPDPDTYAPAVGFSYDFPVGRDPLSGETWLIHCYGMVGAGRDLGADSGGAKEIYAVIGQSPRNLDRNVTLFGRVIDGIERLSILPRGTALMGFYSAKSERTPIIRVRVAADVPPEARMPYEVLRTDGAAFQSLLKSARTRTDAWSKYEVGRLGVCNVKMPVRVKP